MSYVENLRAFSFDHHSYYPSLFPIEFHQAFVFIPAEKNSQIVITNLMACSTADGTAKPYINPGYCEIWGSDYPREKYYTTWTRRLTAPFPAGSAAITVDNVMGLGVGSWIALNCISDWTRQECLEVASVVGLTVNLAGTTTYAYNQNDTVVDLSYPSQIPCNVIDPTQYNSFGQTPALVGMVDKEGENLYTAPKNLPLRLRMYGNRARIVVAGYWKDAR